MKRTILTAALALVAGAVSAQQPAGAGGAAREYPATPRMSPEMTEFWTPQPPVVTPAPAANPTAAPSDAIVLLGPGVIEFEHVRNGAPVGWDFADGVLTVKPRSGGDIRSKRSFGDCQLHLEWRSPSEVSGESQGRGNSGVFLQELYEVQILDNYDNETYMNGAAGSIYKQSPPLVNPIRPPGEWNTYDIIWAAPVFRESDGKLLSPARITVIFNGVVVQNNYAIRGTTEYIGHPRVVPHGPAPISIQDHGNLVSYRNIWIREL